MKWIGKRISYVDQENKSTFIITPENVGFVKALIGAWFFMWIAIGAVISWAWATFDLKEQEKIALFVFMIFWAYYFVRIGRMFLWLLFGSEFIKVDKISLTIKTAIKSYGKSKEYYLENIEKIRVHVPEKKSFQAAWENSPWIRGGERLEFDYRGKTIRFGRKLDEKEAKLLFQVLTKRIEDQLRKKK
jgi:hypothetical protein